MSLIIINQNWVKNHIVFNNITNEMLLNVSFIFDVEFFETN